MIGTTLVSALFSKFWKLFWTYLTLQDKHNICVYDRDRMVVGFKTTYAIGAYHH